MKKVVIAAAVVAFALVGLANSVKESSVNKVQSGISATDLKIEAASK